MFKPPRTYVPSNLRSVTLPVSDKPQQWDSEGYELDENGKRKGLTNNGSYGNGANEDPRTLLSIEESLVLLRSLPQTRQHHVEELFPIFTTAQVPRSKAKYRQGEEENPIPKHDIKLIGKCGLTVGPVSFQDVSLWECRFLEPPPKPKTPPPRPSQQVKSPAKSNQATPSLIAQVDAFRLKTPWLAKLIAKAAQKIASNSELRQLGFVVDHIDAGIPLPPALPNGDAPEVPPLPRKHTSPGKPPVPSRTPPATQGWRYRKDKAPLLLLSFAESPSTKLAIPVQLSFFSYSNSKAPSEADSPGVTDNMLSRSEDDTISIATFLPCRGWGKWENAPELTRHYRTVSTRRKQGNLYPDAPAGHQMMRPLPIDGKNDFGPIGGISIPAGLLEPVSVSLTNLDTKSCAHARQLAREIENFDKQGEADVDLTPRSANFDRAATNPATSSLAQGSSSRNDSTQRMMNNGNSVETSQFASRDQTRQEAIPAAQPMQGIESAQTEDNRPMRYSQTDKESGQASPGISRVPSQSPRKRSKRTEPLESNEEYSRSASPANGAADSAWPLGNKPWKVQLFERLLKRVPKRAFLKCRLPSPVQPEILNAVIYNNPSKPVVLNLSQKTQTGKKTASSAITSQAPSNTSSSSRKRKAVDTAPIESLETPVTLDKLEADIIKSTSETLVVDDTLRQTKRNNKPAFDSSVPCQGCGKSGLKIWRKGPNGKATLCSACGEKFAQGTLGPLVAPNARPVNGTASNAAHGVPVQAVPQSQHLSSEVIRSTATFPPNGPSTNSNSSSLPQSETGHAPMVPSVLQPTPNFAGGLGAASLPGQQLPSVLMPYPGAPRPQQISAPPPAPSGITPAHPIARLERSVVPSSQNHTTSRLPPTSPRTIGGQCSNPPTPLFGPFPISAGSPSGRSTKTGSPGRLYHVPEPTQGYIPPRRIMPAAIYNPLIDATQKGPPSGSTRPPVNSSRQQQQPLATHSIVPTAIALPSPAIGSPVGRATNHGLPLMASQAVAPRAPATSDPNRAFSEAKTPNLGSSECNTPGLPSDMAHHDVGRAETTTPQVERRVPGVESINSPDDSSRKH